MTRCLRRVDTDAKQYNKALERSLDTAYSYPIRKLASPRPGPRNTDLVF